MNSYGRVSYTDTVSAVKAGESFRVSFLPGIGQFKKAKEAAAASRQPLLVIEIYRTCP